MRATTLPYSDVSHRPSLAVLCCESVSWSGNGFLQGDACFCLSPVPLDLWHSLCVGLGSVPWTQTEAAMPTPWPDVQANPYLSAHG